MSLTLKSLAIIAGGLIPQKFTCDGEDFSPHLSWEGAPAGTSSYVLIMDDPDAPVGTWDHWILFNIPPHIQSLEEGVQHFHPDVRFGRNSWGRLKYGGPCPPDREHTYVFKLYALDTALPLESGASKKDIESDMDGHILEMAALKARYDRPRR
ncbi:YbhB/YbcL family Raf kinase inhibitor-like protein [Candidatus Bealeia paramacronuclearis]|uniref:YbhB/YbcL family Raf kinase inhibitor-like protein n=1 Tax=Candidatus Bealeia paramacronuclearis TaxID=1921001 RepID=A0ABZ2C4U1_9PROT|nr:YbhB/YbcL family Raf kinase inhibitor-like protein [Candidatus Bealeia paramacronuclearis]